MSILICFYYIVIPSLIILVLSIQNNSIFSFTKIYSNLQINIISNVFNINIFSTQILQNWCIYLYFEIFLKDIVVISWKDGKFWVKQAEIQPPIDLVAQNMDAGPVIHHYVLFWCISQADRVAKCRMIVAESV